ncbi:MAG: phytoene/squalene synthase family protein [Pirellulales bacterium]|nr:phytoene/squalene synthase family protein [Pirellulales bacterium]
MHTDPRSLQVSYRRCRRISRQAGSSFYAGFALLPRPKRRAMDALYAFLRHADDVTDAPAGGLTVRRERLDGLRRRLEEALGDTSSGVPADEEGWIFPALADTVERFHVPPDCLFDVLDGMEMDLDRNRYATFDELRWYCERVASAVGVACIHLWGFRGQGTAEAAPAVELARRVGVALQLTNILRDLREDVAAGRVYLPEEDFHISGYSAEELFRGEANPVFTRLIGRTLDRAEEHYQAASALYPLILPEGRRIFGLMVSTYHALLEKIAFCPAEVLRRRVTLSCFARVRLALRWSIFPPPAPEKFVLKGNEAAGEL